jgi:hypothetical protein
MSMLLEQETHKNVACNSLKYTTILKIVFETAIPSTTKRKQNPTKLL